MDLLPPKQLLLVENNPSDVLLTQHALERYAPAQWRITVVESIEAAKEVLAGPDPVDEILLDLGLGKTEGAVTLEQMMDLAPLAPVVVFTMTPSTAINARISSGKVGYISKNVLIDDPAQLPALMEQCLALYPQRSDETREQDGRTPP